MKIRHVVMLLGGLFANEAFAAKDKAEPTTGFNIIGYIQTFSLDDSTDPLSGAKMTVNGITVIVPKNLKIVMPGTYLTANDIFRGPKGTKISGVNKASCIAMDDIKEPTCNKQPEFPYTAEIVGNIADIVDATGKSIGQEYIAGLVNIGQIPLQTSGGFIKTICYAGNEPGCTMAGELLVAPTLKSNFIAARVRLNDPKGRFGLASLPGQDDRFKADDENPTVHAATGYPVCIPRVDPKKGDDSLCSKKNRPEFAPGKFLRRFTIGQKTATNKNKVPIAGAPPCSQCDSHSMTPLVVDDYVIYSGTMQKDNKGIFISAYSLEADLGIFTSPGVDPAYVFIEETLLGAGGNDFPGINQETGPGKPPATRIIPGQSLVTRFKIVGFTTDPSRNVDMFALDIDANTGIKSPRLLSSATPELFVPQGRFKLVTEQQVFMPPTREIRAQIQGTADKFKQDSAANGLEWGKYDAPVAEYLFPEGTAFGGKSPQSGLIPANFEDLCFLSVGFGPLDTLGRCENNDCGPTINRLVPWPASELEPRQITRLPKTMDSRKRSTHQPPGIFCPQPKP